jgi:hypothetical protein
LLSVEGGEDIAEVIMRRGPRGKGTKSTQKGQLLVAEQRNIDDRLRTGQNRQKTQQQHLVERVHHLAALARIRQITEILQKDNSFAKRTKTRRYPVHPDPPSSDSQDHHRFSTSALCHQLLRPIALLIYPGNIDKSGQPA